jgi:hypothetical protein
MIDEIGTVLISGVCSSHQSTSKCPRVTSFYREERKEPVMELENGEGI